MMNSEITYYAKTLRRQAESYIYEAEHLEKLATRYSHIFAYLSNLPNEVRMSGKELSEQLPNLTCMEGSLILKTLYKVYPSKITKENNNYIISANLGG